MYCEDSLIGIIHLPLIKIDIHRECRRSWFSMRDGECGATSWQMWQAHFFLYTCSGFSELLAMACVGSQLRKRVCGRSFGWEMRPIKFWMDHQMRMSESLMGKSLRFVDKYKCLVRLCSLTFILSPLSNPRRVSDFHSTATGGMYASVVHTTPLSETEVR